MPQPEPVPGDRPDYAELFAALPVAVLVIDPDDRITHANAVAEQMLCVSERLMLGQPLAAILPPPQGLEAGDGFGFAVYDIAIETVRGIRMRVDFVETGIADHPGWRVVTLHNAAGSRRLAQSSDRSSGARAAVGAAAMLAHEIRNPLSGIRGAAQLLGPGELTCLITTEVDRIAGLIDRMQEFGDTRPLPLSGENIYPLLAHVRGVAQAGFARGVRIEERYDPSLPLALVNRDALTQVLINLLKNAREAVAGVREPLLTITTGYRHGITRSDGGQRVPLPIEVCVIDNGPGAPADIVEHLFDPFVSGKPEGQGLGLALVDKLVRDMGGLVQYAREGDPPATILRLLLPRAQG
ncbi:ATP-binding protein [Sphingomonas sp. KR1UV-12]|uniref:histidine kinase n=1 Tax=Sphingomonas aurea TaxID=3063994 RepID=A0ABT9EGS7_9SPHN|nr:ATP-binding protein [Sphingomonas sp. KR1UV-12]MDP1026171.1 ATP-binding protein [Sphingomonas sp. KR1UV-12]